MTSLISPQFNLTSIAGAIVGIVAVLLAIGLFMNWLGDFFNTMKGSGNLYIFIAFIIILIVIISFLIVVFRERN